MGSLFLTLLQFAAGTLWGFSFSVWAGVTAVLLLAGTMLAAAVPQVLDPIAVEVALRPRRVALWAPITLVVLPAATVALVLTIIGAPLAILLLFGALVGGALGYLGAGLILGDRVLTRAGYVAPPWLACIVGVLLLRLVRLVPVIGGALHLIVALFALAAAAVIARDLAWSWHLRRLPDDVQFRDEGIIEWDPDTGPPPHPPAP